MVSVVKNGVSYLVSDDKAPAYIAQGYVVEKDERKEQPKKKRKKGAR